MSSNVCFCLFSIVSMTDRWREHGNTKNTLKTSRKHHKTVTDIQRISFPLITPWRIIVSLGLHCSSIYICVFCCSYLFVLICFLDGLLKEGNRGMHETQWKQDIGGENVRPYVFTYFIISLRSMSSNVCFCLFSIVSMTDRWREHGNTKNTMKTSRKHHKNVTDFIFHHKTVTVFCFPRTASHFYVYGCVLSVFLSKTN